VSEFVSRFADFVTLEHAFALDATLAGMLVGAVCGTIGVFLVLRGESLVGDAAGHATLPGVCAAFLITGSKSLPVLLSGALVSALVSIAALSAIGLARRTREDAAIGTVLSVSFGVGVVLLSVVQREPSGAQAGLNSFLFGSAAAVSRSQLAQLAVLGGAAVATVIALRRPLAIATFDPVFARSIGLPTRVLHGLVLVALCIAVVVSIQAVGVVLVSAMVIIPPTTARFLQRSLGGVLVASACLGALTGWIGAAASYIFDGLPTGPTMVLVAGILLGLALFAGRHGGWIWEVMSKRGTT
jgi:ABC-type Mn2+/Zn2+ transport system permease subunit